MSEQQNLLDGAFIAEPLLGPRPAETTDGVMLYSTMFSIVKKKMLWAEKILVLFHYALLNDTGFAFSLSRKTSTSSSRLRAKPEVSLLAPMQFVMPSGRGVLPWS
jgi:hypothetical protein